VKFKTAKINSAHLLFLFNLFLYHKWIVAEEDLAISSPHKKSLNVLSDIDAGDLFF